MRRSFAAFALAAALTVSSAAADEKGTVDVALIDVPYNTAHGLRAPSMQQALTATASTYEVVHVELQALFGPDHPVLNKTAVAAFDLLNLVELPLPLTDVWLHEEFHRAVMGNRGIDSFDDVYRFRTGGNAINVSHVRDEDLIRLKAEHPAELVRLGAAGVEGETLLVQELEKNRFFHDSGAWHLPLYWLTKFSVTGYIASGSSRDSDADTDEANAKEGADVKRRDFTGHDFLGWMYDLSRPDEPYAARGIHPSGVGINRYRKTTDLTPEERDFLQRQGRLSAINFLDPNLFGVSDVKSGAITWNANAAHYLTSFGYTIDGNLFLRTAGQQLFVTLHRYSNHDRSFPGVDVEWVEKRVQIGGRDYVVSPRVALWMQPERQQFRTTDASLGGLAGLRVDLPARGQAGSYVVVDAKSAGWVAGNEHLDGSVSLRFGVTTTFRR